MIVNILAGFFFSYYFVNIARIPGAIKKGFGLMPHNRIKPFDCVTCLSVWCSVVMYFLPTQLVQFICIIFAAGFLGSKIK